MRPRLLRAAPALALATLVPVAARAATPNPDRPSFSRTGFLVADRSVELEGGANWAPDAPSASFLPKVGLGRWEPRVAVDVGSGAATITPGFKVGLVQQEGLGLAAHLHATVPRGGGGGTAAEAGALVTGVLAGGQVLQANLDVQTWVSAGGVAVTQTPLALLGGVPLGKKLSAFGEGVLRFGGGGGGPPVDLDAGLGWSLTRSVVLDCALRWTTGTDLLGLTVGATGNFGSFQ